MLLNLIVGDYSMNLELPSDYLEETRELFDKLDRDMDAGWQMGREWVESPNHLQRCQIAANKLLTALENDNRDLAMLSAGYIVSRMPAVKSVRIDTTGDPSATEFTEGRI